MASLKLLSTYLGPSVHAEEPSIEVILELDAAELARIPASAAKMAAGTARFFTPEALPGADLLEAGAFVVSLAKALAIERGAVIRAAKARRESGAVILTLGFHHPRGALLALDAAVRLAVGADRAEPAAIAKVIEKLMGSLVPFTPDPQVGILLRHALAVGVPARRVDEKARLWQFGWGCRSDIRFEAAAKADSHIAYKVTVGKDVTKRLAQTAGFRIQPGVIVRRAEELEGAAKAVGFPCVTKPLAGSHSRGVTVGIRDLHGLRLGWAAAEAEGKGDVLVERHAEGDPHRLMVVRGKVWKAILRPRPSVVGDGVSTAEALARARNASILAGRRPSSLWQPAPLDAAFVACLRRQGLAPTSVPEAGRKVLIREIPMMDQGASAYVDVTSRLHPEIREAAEELARMVGAGCLGIDLVAEDVGSPEGAAFLEANLTPELRVLKAAGVSDASIAAALLGDAVGRIPATLVVAPRASHAAILGRHAPATGTGWTDGRGVGTGARRLPVQVPTPHDGVDLLVRRPSVESLLILADPADIVAGGIPVDRADRVLLAEEAGLPAPWVEALRRHSGELVLGPAAAI